jgi:hypothetical protein
MPTSAIDTTIERTVIDGFSFPLGVRPLEDIEPRPGYTSDFESADGGEGEGDWEEWPDRYLFDTFLSADRLLSLCRAMFSILPGRVYPILDILGNDAYREVDPYIAYEPIGLDRFLEGLRRHRDWFFEDGLVGFGAMSDEPFLHIYIDEHKVVTIRVQSEQRDRVEKILAAFDLHQIEDPIGVDSVSHEHRCVLLAPNDRPDLLAAEEIVEELLDLWRLDLNVDREGNLDDRGKELGITGWRLVVRRWEGADEPPQYAEVFLTAESLGVAEELAYSAAASPQTNGEPGREPDLVERLSEPPVDLAMILADRVTPETYAKLLVEVGAPIGSGPPDAPSIGVNQVHLVRWLID